MTADSVHPTTLARRGRVAFVVATIVLWLSAIGAGGICVLWIGTLADPVAYFMLAVIAVAGTWPAAILALVSVSIVLYHRHRRGTPAFGLSLAALACHIPLVVTLTALGLFDRIAAW